MSRVLLLGTKAQELRSIRGFESSICTNNQLNDGFLREKSVDLIISFGYRHILSESILKAVNWNAVNLHISLLPWNRGADPNFWSWYDQTPKGVSVHWMASGVDQGDLIAQRQIDLDPKDTLSKTYENLEGSIIRLFSEVADQIIEGHAPRNPQSGVGTFHLSKERLELWKHFPLGWDTPCQHVIEFGRKARESI